VVLEATEVVEVLEALEATEVVEVLEALEATEVVEVVSKYKNFGYESIYF
jgi:hypothetical protein